jgi:lipopolysaccharide/colanic/teichoic acid biosynthesis glycosyltransferase
MVAKRLFDILFSGLIFLLFFWLILLSWFLAVLDTNTNGFFIQERVGQYGKLFKIYKLRTIQVNADSNKVQKSKFGQFLREYKIDELPQLINVLKGEMSIVGPRPDIAGYYDRLNGDNRKILELKPGLTSLASLKYYNEDELLENDDNPLVFNDDILFPDKVKMNLEYYHEQSFCNDLKIVIATFRFVLKRAFRVL